MSTNKHGGVNFHSGAAEGSKYHVRSVRGNRPVAYVSFDSAMRFTDWLHNGKGSGSTESGAYTIGPCWEYAFRNPNAKFFIPNANEWYKAAYHKNDRLTGNYWDYPMSSDTVPYSDQPPGSDAPASSNTANGYDDGYAVTASPSFSDTRNYLTDVGLCGISKPLWYLRPGRQCF